MREHDIHTPTTDGSAALDVMRLAFETGACTPIQRAALELDTLGIHTFPLPKGLKEPRARDGAAFFWKRFGLTHYSIERDALLQVFAGACNIAAIVGTGKGGALTVIDCDTPAALDWHIAQLDARGLPVWATHSARGGHVWLLLADGPTRNLSGSSARHLPGADLKANNGYVLVPPSQHPSGPFYTWYRRDTSAPPLLTRADVDWLQDQDGLPVVLGPARQARHALTHSTRLYLATGKPQGQRNNGLFRAAAELQRVTGDVQPALDRARADGLPESEIQRTAASASRPDRLTPQEYRAGTAASIPSTSRQNPNAVWRRAAAFSSRHPWQGRTANTDRAVFAALIERARLDTRGTGTFRASVREVATAARVHAMTAHTALDRLAKASQDRQALIESVGTTDLGARCWQFTGAVLADEKGQMCEISTVVATQQCNDTVLISHISNHDTVSVSHTSKTDTATYLESDASESGAYGKTGMLAYLALLRFSEPASAAEVAAAANLTLSQVRHAFRAGGKLRDDGLIEHLGHNRWAANYRDYADLQQAAHGYGKLGADEHRRARFLLERQRQVSGRVIDWRRNHDPGAPYYKRLPPQDRPAPHDTVSVSVSFSPQDAPQTAPSTTTTTTNTSTLKSAPTRENGARLQPVELAKRNPPGDGWRLKRTPSHKLGGDDERGR